ncbi:MAG: 3-isopropylmalate dehydrogenase [Candidatus Gastranaerophilales bacterium]|nr:3-isopropylmalate dehydrogenase [Candidatus Gastranaerophilales bacterium]
MKTNFNIAVLPGDGIGPEVIDQGIKVLKAVSKKYGLTFNFIHGLIGGAELENSGIPITDETIRICKSADAVYLGAVGDFKYDKLEPHLRPEQALLKIRKELNLFANLRPAVVYDDLLNSSTLKEEIIKGVDIMIVRELTGGLYFGQPRGIESNTEKKAFNTMTYTESEIERIAKVAFEVAMKRNKRLCSVDKANVLEVSRLWREVVERVAKNYPDVELSHMYVDNAAMQLIRNPRDFDVMLTENMFGDILSDEASMLTGSLGMLASASLSQKGPSMYEPSHGSAPQFKGLDKLNPIATILSAGMMLKYSFMFEEAATAIETSVKQVLREGYRTEDIFNEGNKLVGTSNMGSLIAEALLNS